MTVAVTVEATVEAVTVETLLNWARARLGGGSDGLVDAEALLSRITGKSAASLIADNRKPVSERQAGEYKSLVERRARGEPVAYLNGQKEFWSLALAVTPDVLIPRPETELLVEEVLARVRPSRRADILDCASILELGTGSGAIAVALASELPHCAIVATDLSAAALSVAEHNRQKLALENIAFCLGHWFQAVSSRRFDLIVANPPYIAAGDRHLGQGDLRFEPTAALVSPADGLTDLRLIITGAPAHLNAGGMLLLEHGYEQAAAVRDLFKRNRFVAVTTRRDFGGNERVTGGTLTTSNE